MVELDICSGCGAELINNKCIYCGRIVHNKKIKNKNYDFLHASATCSCSYYEENEDD